MTNIAKIYDCVYGNSPFTLFLTPAPGKLSVGDRTECIVRDFLWNIADAVTGSKICCS